MGYKTKTELEDFMLKDGDIPLWNKNWILSTVHNTPHDALAENSDVLKERLDILSNKSGLSSTKKKSDGFPIWLSTSYINTGNTFTDAVSILDNQLKTLENELRSVLRRKAQREAESWIIEVSNSSIEVMSTELYPAPLQILNLDSIITIFVRNTEDGEIYYASNIEDTWYKHPQSLKDVLGAGFALEYHTSVDVSFAETTSFTVLGTYYHQKENYRNYLKLTQGIIDLTAETPIQFNSPEGVIRYFSGPADLYLSRTIGTLDFSDKRIQYFPMSPSYEETFLLEKPSRLISTSEIKIISYKPAEFISDYSNHTLEDSGIFIEDGSAEGIESISSYEIRKINTDEFAMILVDENGHLLFRTSTDGVNWLVPTNQDGIILEESEDRQLDFPTFLPIESGYLLFFNVYYTYGVLDDIGYMYSEDGTNWILPSNFFDIQGIFPKLVRKRNGDIYLFYFTENGIEAVKLSVSTGRKFVAGG